MEELNKFMEFLISHKSGEDIDKKYEALVKKHRFIFEVKKYGPKALELYFDFLKEILENYEFEYLDDSDNEDDNFTVKKNLSDEFLNKVNEFVGDNPYLKKLEMSFMKISSIEECEITQKSENIFYICINDGRDWNHYIAERTGSKSEGYKFRTLAHWDYHRCSIYYTFYDEPEMIITHINETTKYLIELSKEQIKQLKDDKKICISHENSVRETVIKLEDKKELIPEKYYPHCLCY